MRLLTWMLPLALLAGCSDNDNQVPGKSAQCGAFALDFVTRDRMNQAVDSFTAGEVIRFEAQIANRAATSQSLVSNDSCGPLVFRVTNTAGAVVWESTQGLGCGAALIETVYAAGQVRTFTAEWNQTLAGGGAAPTGSYRASAEERTVECGADFSQARSLRLQ